MIGAFLSFRNEARADSIQFTDRNLHSVFWTTIVISVGHIFGLTKVKVTKDYEYLKKVCTVHRTLLNPRSSEFSRTGFVSVALQLLTHKPSASFNAFKWFFW